MANLKGVIYMSEKNFKEVVVKKYYFRKGGIVDSKAFDWIGKARFESYPFGHAEREIYAVELNRKLGFADCNGEIVIPIIYDREHHNIEDNAILIGNREYLDLRKNNLYGLIRTDGTVAIECQWGDMSLDKLSEDLIPVARRRKWGFANVKTGKTQVQPAFDKVEPFENGFAPFCNNEKWGVIDKDGNIVVQARYLLPPYFFEGDFAIAFEGGSYRATGKHQLGISNSNCKIVNKKGYEIVTDCSWIKRTGVNTFRITRELNGESVTTEKQFIAFPDYIIVIDDGEYQGGYITTEGKYSERDVRGSTYYPSAKYIGGGTWSAIDYTNKAIRIRKSKLRNVKENLLMDN